MRYYEELESDRNFDTDVWATRRLTKACSEVDALRLRCQVLESAIEEYIFASKFNVPASRIQDAWARLQQALSTSDGAQQKRGEGL
jgi:hypothetical protein